MPPVRAARSRSHHKNPELAAARVAAGCVFASVPNLGTEANCFASLAGTARGGSPVCGYRPGNGPGV